MRRTAKILMLICAIGHEDIEDCQDDMREIEQAFDPQALAQHLSLIHI